MKTVVCSFAYDSRASLINCDQIWENLPNRQLGQIDFLPEKASIKFVIALL